jgi:hypothetical protein
MFLGIRLGDNGCGSLPDGTFLVSPMVVTSFASAASNFLGKDHLLSSSG